MSIASVSSAYSSYEAYLAAKSGKTAETSSPSAETASAATESAASSPVNSALKQIDSKISTGAKLTDREMSYLEAQDSAAYKEVEAINKERGSYRKQLDGVKTKLDAEQIRSTKMQELADEIKSVNSNKDLTDDEKTSQLSSIQKRQMAIVDETQKFTSSASYRNLNLTTKSNFQSMLESEDSDISNLLSYFSSTKTDATNFLKIFNSVRSGTSQATSGYFNSQLNAAQKLVDASFQAQNVRQQSVITQVLARESAKLTNSASTTRSTETASRVNLMF